MDRQSLERDKIVSETSHLLHACKDYIRDLSGHPDVIHLIESGKIILKESSSFFLTDLERLSSAQWAPSDHGILCARVRTVGAATYHYSFSEGNKTMSWRLFDVGGTRGQRKAWLPFFEGTTAVLFLAPVSVFDEFLDEVPETNRMDDSMQLFSHISTSPLLRKTHIVLFLNKSDILKRKLIDGIISSHMRLALGKSENAIT